MQARLCPCCSEFALSAPILGSAFFNTARAAVECDRSQAASIMEAAVPTFPARWAGRSIQRSVLAMSPMSGSSEELIDC